MDMCFDDPWTRLVVVGIYLERPSGIPPRRICMNRSGSNTIVLYSTRGSWKHGQDLRSAARLRTRPSCPNDSL